MKNLTLQVLYGVEGITFQVGDNGVKKHYNPVFNKTYAYGSSSNVKRNVKELFSELSSIQTPSTEFKKEAKLDPKNNTITAGEKEQSGVSTKIDIENPICTICGAWSSDVSEEEKKYIKAALKANFNVSDMIPLHPLLQYLGKKEKGVFVGDQNSTITIGDKNTTLKTPEEAAAFVGCSIEDAQKAFEGLRPMNLYEDKETATGLYKETFTIDIEAFGRVKRSDCQISDEEVERLLSNGWRITNVRGWEYLSPSRERLLELWGYFINALIDWDFSSNNSLHGNVKSALRYTLSFNANKINNCTSARLVTDKDKPKAEMVLREHPEVTAFNSTALEGWYDCEKNNVVTSMDADDEVKEALMKIGEENIL